MVYIQLHFLPWQISSGLFLCCQNLSQKILFINIKGRIFHLLWDEFLITVILYNNSSRNCEVVQLIFINKRRRPAQPFGKQTHKEEDVWCFPALINQGGFVAVADESKKKMETLCLLNFWPLKHKALGGDLMALLSITIIYN